MKKEKNVAGEFASARPMRGRPKDIDKQEAILDAALALFSTQGLDNVGLEIVAAKAGVARKTVYGHFGSKLALFEAVLVRETERIEREFASHTTEYRDIEGLLAAWGRTHLALSFQPDMLALDQLIKREANRHPDLVARLYQTGPVAGRDAVAKLIEQAVARGELNSETDALQAAEDFLGVLMGMLIVERLLGIAKPLAKSQVRARAAHAAQLVVQANRFRS